MPDPITLAERHEAERDRRLLRRLLIEVDVVDEDGARVTHAVGQPSPGRYRREDYGWDPAFFVHSLLAAGELELAGGMLDAIARKVRLAGYLPLVTRWSSRDHTASWRLRARPDPRFSQVTHPPLLAQTALHLANEVGRGRAGTARLRRHARAAQTNIDWLFAHRVAPGRRLLSVIDPIETGMDSLIAWDACLERLLPSRVLREFVIHHASAFLSLRYARLGWDLARIYAHPRSCVIEPVSFNVLAARELLALRELWAMLGEAALAERAARLGKGLLESIEAVLWQDARRAYLPQARLPSGAWRPLPQVSVDSLYPLLLPGLPPDRLEPVFALLTGHFSARRLVPVSPCAGLGRGRRSGLRPRLWGANQVWANANMFVRDGLRHHARRATGPVAGHMAAYADRIDADWRELKAGGGYREYYHQDGRGGGEALFFWDCLRRATFPVACAARA
jgi:hypothetical protein